jgi:hypothetical protein
MIILIYKLNNRINKGTDHKTDYNNEFKPQQSSFPSTAVTNVQINLPISALQLGIAFHLS